MFGKQVSVTVPPTRFAGLCAGASTCQGYALDPASLRFLLVVSGLRPASSRRPLRDDVHGHRPDLAHWRDLSSAMNRNRILGGARPTPSGARS